MPCPQRQGLKSKRRCSNGTAYSKLRNSHGAQHEECEEGVNTLVEKFNTLIADNAEITKVDTWGQRALAYPMNDETVGYYVVINFTSKPDFPAELDRIYKITDGVLRSLIVAKEPEEEKPAPVAADEQAPAAQE